MKSADHRSFAQAAAPGSSPSKADLEGLGPTKRGSRETGKISAYFKTVNILLSGDESSG
jgi:hypothetical protein